MALIELREWEDAPPAPQMFGAAGREHMERYGSEPEHFAWIGWKNHHHSVNNPYAQFQDEYTLEEISEAPEIYAPLTKLQCSPTSDGSAAAVRRLRALRRAARALGPRGRDRRPGDGDRPDSSTFDSRLLDQRSWATTCRAAAAERAYERGRRRGRARSTCCELHDCFAANELITYEALGFAAEGEGHKLVEAKATTYGGAGPVVNPSGGLISKGHPLGATGLAQCSELTWQLRGTADARQVPDAEVGAAAQHRARRAPPSSASTGGPS